MPGQSARHTTDTKNGSIEVKYSGSDDFASTVQHELIHALHRRNERARGAELEYRRAMEGIEALYAQYAGRKSRNHPSWDIQPTHWDNYSATDVNEFFVGVTQVLAGSTRFKRLRDFVHVLPELRAHARVVLNAPAEPGLCAIS